MITLRKFFFILCSLLTVVLAHAQQIRGVVTDAETGDSIPMVSVIYRGHHVAVVSDAVARQAYAG